MRPSTLTDSLREYARELRRERGLDFSTRIGINSGEVVVGKIGDDLRMDYTAQGHTVGLAQRMESLAEPGKIYLTGYAADRAKGYFQLEDLGAFNVKGVSEPVPVFELSGIGTLRTRFDVSRSRGLSRFVGRDADMQALESALEAARSGKGRAVGVVASAGVGKSRLCFEFTERCRAQGLNVLQGSGVPHGRSVPLLPILEIFRAYFAIDDRDDPRGAREKIAGRLLLIDDKFRDVLPIVFDFLGVPDPAHPAPSMDADARRRRIVAVVRRLVEAGSADGFVIMIEDLHWLDEASDAFVAEYVDAINNGPGLLLLNFRPEYHADWMQKSWYQQLPLATLRPGAIQEMLVDLLGEDQSIAGLADRVHARTEGNPYFTEEIVRSLVESGVLQGKRGSYRLSKPIESLEVPYSVQAVLSARIDRLREREKQLLQKAAVIGKEFPEPLLAAVAELPEAELTASLAALCSAEFIHQQALYPIAEYAFAHH